AVTDIELIVCGIDRQVGGAAEILCVGAAAALAPVAELPQELALRRELEDLVVLLAVSSQPDIVFRIDNDAVFGRRPFVALPGAAPWCEQFAVLIELEPRGRRDAATRGGRRHGGAGETLFLLQRARPVQSPDVIMAVDGHPADRADRPLLGE